MPARRPAWTAGFLSTPSARRATTVHLIALYDFLFLSTPSARRATQASAPCGRHHGDFYPRPPRGGRPSSPDEQGDYYQISIHALREEGDASMWSSLPTRQVFLSTPSARRATACGFGDRCSITYFYPRPPRGGRQRRGNGFCCAHQISIHALREEGDGLASSSALGVSHFYPRPPRGGRQQKQRENTLLLSHYTPLCTNCKEMLAKQTAKSHRYLRKRLVFRCEASRKTMCAADSHWPDIKRSARCLGQILGAVQRARPWSGSCCPAGRTADCPRQGRSGRSALL